VSTTRDSQKDLTKIDLLLVRSATDAHDVAGLVGGAAVLGLRATRGWMNSVGQGVHVIAFLRDDMNAGA
jgi:hypothetical protein